MSLRSNHVAPSEPARVLREEAEVPGPSGRGRVQPPSGSTPRCRIRFSDASRASAGVRGRCARARPATSCRSHTNTSAPWSRSRSLVAAEGLARRVLQDQGPSGSRGAAVEREPHRGVAREAVTFLPTAVVGSALAGGGAPRRSEAPNSVSGPAVSRRVEGGPGGVSRSGPGSARRPWPPGPRRRSGASAVPRCSSISPCSISSVPPAGLRREAPSAQLGLGARVTRWSLPHARLPPLDERLRPRSEPRPAVGHLVSRPVSNVLRAWSSPAAAAQFACASRPCSPWPIPAQHGNPAPLRRRCSSAACAAAAARSRRAP